jgi:hypothetical protein
VVIGWNGILKAIGNVWTREVAESINTKFTEINCRK